VQPTYREQILHAQFHDKEGSKIRKNVEAGVEMKFRVADGWWILDDGTTVVRA